MKNEVKLNIYSGDENLSKRLHAFLGRAPLPYPERSKKTLFLATSPLPVASQTAVSAVETAKSTICARISQIAGDSAVAPASYATVSVPSLLKSTARN
jgi:hypothetical protein